MIQKGCRSYPFRENSRVLYLGAASGTTASHISDIVSDGMIFCIEFSKRVFIDLVEVCEKRKNMIPILADARKPEEYSRIVGKVDVIYQDLAQRNQSEIFLKNLRLFLRGGGFGILMVKARSINVAAKPRNLFQKIEQELEGRGYKVLENIHLDPYERDHAAIVVSQ
jgi:fibrillarin-like pre-rRNA processing protein